MTWEMAEIRKRCLSAQELATLSVALSSSFLYPSEAAANIQSLSFVCTEEPPTLSSQCSQVTSCSHRRKLAGHSRVKLGLAAASHVLTPSTTVLSTGSQHMCSQPGKQWEGDNRQHRSRCQSAGEHGVRATPCLSHASKNLALFLATV